MYILNETEYNEKYRDKDENYKLLVLGILIFGNYILFKFSDIFRTVRKKLKK
jgi:hypothetical protein